MNAVDFAGLEVRKVDDRAIQKSHYDRRGNSVSGSGLSWRFLYSKNLFITIQDRLIVSSKSFCDVAPTLLPCLGAVDTSEMNFKYEKSRFRFCCIAVHPRFLSSPLGSITSLIVSIALPQLIAAWCDTAIDAIRSLTAKNTDGRTSLPEIFNVSKRKQTSW
jgi:hypothetical protein